MGAARMQNRSIRRLRYLPRQGIIDSEAEVCIGGGSYGGLRGA